MPKIPLVLSEPMLQAGYKEYILWNTETSPHMAVAGVTGSGKTYCTKLILARVSKHIPQSYITVCDFKGDSDFAFLAGCKRFYRFSSCIAGLENFCSDFKEMQKSGVKNGFQLFFIDEWSSFLNSLDKKAAEDAKKELSNLLMLGRSFNVHVLLSQQRLSAEDFGKCRDQFSSVLSLGNLTKEVIGMLFNDYKEYIKKDRKRGTGYMLTHGTDFLPFVVPEIGSMELVNRAIKEAVTR